MPARRPFNNLSHRAKVAPRQLRRALNRQIAGPGRRPVQEFSNPEIQILFHPHSEKGIDAGYPSSHVQHEFAKLPGETRGNFVDLAQARKIVRETPEVARVLKRYPKAETFFEEFFLEAVRSRGLKSLTDIWAKAPKEYIDRIVRTGQQNPSKMNEKVGEVIAEAFGKEAKPRTILDIGTFAGGTITGAIRKLSLEQRRQLRLVLVDVAGSVVRGYAVPKLVKMGVPKSNITVIPANFYAAAVAFKQMSKPLYERYARYYAKQFRALEGKIDAITAGAATINFAVDLDPFMQSIQRLLKPRGVFVDWEWGGAEVESPTVNIRALKKDVVAYKGVLRKDGTMEQRPVTAFDGYVSFLDFWMRTLNYPPAAKYKLFQEIEQAHDFNFAQWIEKNSVWLENLRVARGEKASQPPIGFRNRAYRDGRNMVTSAQKYGLQANPPTYPIAQPGIRNTGNVNWMVVARKS